MDEFDQQIEIAGDTLRQLAEGPGAEAAAALEDVFASAGRRIEETLARAARSGELDFQKMAEAILRDLARIAAETVLAGGNGGAVPGITVNLNANGSADARGILASQGAISSALARAAASGGRFL